MMFLGPHRICRSSKNIRIPCALFSANSFNWANMTFFIHKPMCIAYRWDRTWEDFRYCTQYSDLPHSGCADRNAFDHAWKADYPITGAFVLPPYLPSSTDSDSACASIFQVYVVYLLLGRFLSITSRHQIYGTDAVILERLPNMWVLQLILPSRWCTSASYSEGTPLPVFLSGYNVAFL